MWEKQPNHLGLKEKEKVKKSLVSRFSHRNFTKDLKT